MGEFSIIHWPILLALIFFYFIPYFIARKNKKQNSGAIGALNIFLGWTVIGWVIALVWALSTDAVQPAPQIQVNVPGPAPTAPTLSSTAQKKCPDCAEMVLAEAKKCRFCGHQFGPATSSIGH